MGVRSIKQKGYLFGREGVHLFTDGARFPVQLSQARRRIRCDQLSLEASFSIARSVATTFRMESFDSFRLGPSLSLIRFATAFWSSETTRSFTWSRVAHRAAHHQAPDARGNGTIIRSVRKSPAAVIPPNRATSSYRRIPRVSAQAVFLLSVPELVSSRR